MLRSSYDLWTCVPIGTQKRGVQRFASVVETCKRQRCEILVVFPQFWAPALRDSESRTQNIKALMLVKALVRPDTPSDTRIRQLQGTIGRKPSNLLSSAQGTTWGCSFNCSVFEFIPRFSSTEGGTFSHCTAVGKDWASRTRCPVLYLALFSLPPSGCLNEGAGSW